MIITTKHKFMLWVPTLLYVSLILGDMARDTLGRMAYRISVRGAVSSALIISAALCLSQGGRAMFVAGIVLWVLALGSLLLEDSTLVILHF